jgi:hypothetical protein
MTKKILLSVLLVLGAAISTAQAQGISRGGGGASAAAVQSAAVVLDAADECVTLDVAGMGTGVWDVTGTFTGTVTFYVAVNNAAPRAIDVASPDNPGSAVNSTENTAGSWSGSVAGFRLMRACMTAYASGSATVTLSAAATGGGGAGGGGATGAVEVTEGGATAQITATSGGALQVECVGGTCSSTGSTPYDNSEAITLATANALLTGGRVSAAAPSTTGVVDNDFVPLWVAGTGALNVVFPSAQSTSAAQSGSWTVTANAGTDLNTSALLTTTAFNSAFGTAGTADTQVATVQGIASMTPLQVQSNSANIATETTLDSILTELEEKGDEATLTTRLADATFTGRFAAAAAAADNMANPTTTGVLSYNMCWDNSTWDRCPPEPAHDSPDTGNPIKIGGKARTTDPAAVANGDRADAYFDKLGKQVVMPMAVRERKIKNRIALTTTTETTLVAAGGSGIFRDLSHLSCSNEGATEVRVDIRDAAGGTVWASYDLAPDGGGFVNNYSTPLPQDTANSAWTAQLSAAVSTVYCNVAAVEDK